MSLEEVKMLVYVSIISADNIDYTEEQKQDVISRFDRNSDINSQDWEYILEPIKTDRYYEKFLEILKS